MFPTEFGDLLGRPSRLGMPKLASSIAFARLEAPNLTRTGVSFGHTKLSITNSETKLSVKNIRNSAREWKANPLPKEFLI